MVTEPSRNPSYTICPSGAGGRLEQGAPLLWNSIFMDAVGLSSWFLLQEFLSLLQSGEVMEPLEVSGQQCAEHGHL